MHDSRRLCFACAGEARNRFFVLAAMEGTRRIRVSIEISTLPLEEQIPSLKQIINDHYSESEGEIPLWGRSLATNTFTPRIRVSRLI